MDRWFRFCVRLVLLMCIAGVAGSGPVLAAERTPVSFFAPSPQGEEIIHYTVQRGDTLYSIARRFGTSVQVLMALNRLPNPDRIYVGQTLRVPAPASKPTPTPPPVPPPTGDRVWRDPDAAIELFSPVANALYHSPIEVIGYSRTFEGNVNVRLRDASGEIIAERYTQGGSVDGYDFFHTRLRFVIDEEQGGTLEVFEESAADGSEINKVTVPLILLPGQRVIDLDQPAVGQSLCSPFTVSGYSNTFEANLLVTLANRDGSEIESAIAMGGNLGFYREFRTTLAHPVSTPQPLLVSAFTGDARGIGDIDHTRVPVSLFPADSRQCR